MRSRRPLLQVVYRRNNSWSFNAACMNDYRAGKSNSFFEKEAKKNHRIENVMCRSHVFTTGNHQTNERRSLSGVSHLGWSLPDL